MDLPNYQLQSNNNNIISTSSNNHSAISAVNNLVKLHVTDFDAKYSTTINYLNEELIMLGLPPILEYCDNCSQLNVSHLISVCYELVSLYRRSMRSVTDIQDKNLMVSRELEISQKRHRQTQRKFDEAQRVIDLSQEKERQQDKASRTVIQQLKQEKDEVSRLKSCLVQRDLQYKHEKKKLEREILTLKDHLHNTVGNQSSLRKSVIYLNGTSAIEGLKDPGARKKWMTPKIGSNVKSQEELQNELLKQREARETELILENRDLRECILRMKSQFEGLLYVEALGPSVNHQDSSRDESTNLSLLSSSSCVDNRASENLEDIDDADSILENLSLSSSAPEQHLYDMPYDIMKTTLEKDLRHLLKRLVAKRLKDTKRRKISSDANSIVSQPPTETSLSTNISISSPPHLHDEISSLRLQVSRYEQVIQKQEEMLKRALTSRPSLTNSTSRPLSNSTPIQEEAPNTRPHRQLPSLPLQSPTQCDTNGGHQGRKLSVQEEHLQRQRDILELNLRQHDSASRSTSLKRSSLNTTTFLIKDSSNQSQNTSEPDFTPPKSFIPSRSDGVTHLIAARGKHLSKEYSSELTESNSVQNSSTNNDDDTDYEC